MTFLVTTVLLRRSQEARGCAVARTSGARCRLGHPEANIREPSVNGPDSPLPPTGGSAGGGALRAWFGVGWQSGCRPARNRMTDVCTPGLLPRWAAQGSAVLGVKGQRL